MPQRNLDLDDGLQLPRISESILNRHSRNFLLVAFLIYTSLESLIGEIYPSILDHPASALCKLYHRTLAA
jgi:hypothetical protein